MLKIGLLVAISKKFGVESAKNSKSWHANRGPTETADGIVKLLELYQAPWPYLAVDTVILLETGSSFYRGMRHSLYSP
jgi:hypothetical protein